MSFVHVFFSLIFIKLWCVCSFWQNSGCFSRITWFKTVSRSVDQLKQALGSYMSLWLCFGSLLHFLLMSMYLHPDPVSLSIFAHDWQHDVIIKEERLKIQLLLTGVSCFYLVQRIDSKSWLVPYRHISLFSASWLYSLHYIIHCKKKENLCQQMIVSFFLCVSAWK